MKEEIESQQGNFSILCVDDKSYGRANHAPRWNVSWV